MANYEPMPFVRKFGGSEGIQSTSTATKSTVDSGFVDAAGTAIMKAPVTGACRKCGFAGHLPFQCMNYIQLKKDQKVVLDVSSTSSESDEASVMKKKKEKSKKKKEKSKKKKEKKKKMKKLKERKRKRSSSTSSTSSDSEEERKKRKKKRKRKYSTSSSSSEDVRKRR